MSTSSIIDVPKKADAKDQLGIDNYKNGLTNFIKTAQTPLTIAIQGEWGSGKTSLMNSIRYDICEDNKQFHDIWINTWEHSLLSDEYTTMTNIIRGVILSVIKVLEKDKNQNLEQLKKKALGFFTNAAKSAAKMGANMATGGIAGDATDAFFENDANESSLKDLHAELQNQINSCVEKDNTKGFLFFIDDLDRINPPVAVQILELLKNIFDLDKCIFILAIDYEVVVKGLEPKFGKKTPQNEREFRSFFEKIIQLPFTMPVGQYKVDSLIIDNLKELEYFKKEELTEAISRHIVAISNLTVGANPRSIKRLLNSLSLVRNIMFSVEKETQPTAFEQLINIGVFSIQIAYPYIYRALERNPDFTQWNSQLADSLKLTAISEEQKKKFENNEFFDEEWEQTLYRLCQTDSYLSNRAMQISRLFNNLKSIIEENANVANKTDESSGDISIEDVMTNAIQISSVTSYSDTDEEPKVKEIHKSGFLKNLRDKLHKDLLGYADGDKIKILYKQKAVKSNLTYLRKIGAHNYRLDMSIRVTPKEYILTTNLCCWYYIKAKHKEFNKDLEEADAKDKQAKERFEIAIKNLNELNSSSPENYSFKNHLSINDKHHTVNAYIKIGVPDAWGFLNDKNAMEMYKNQLLAFIKATESIHI